MAQHLTPPERRRLQELAREYRQSGYDVITEPKAEQLPDFIAPFSPAMIARNQTETVVFAVKSAKTLAASSDLQDIAQAVHGRDGWRFELVVTNPRKPAAVITTTAQFLNSVEIQDRLREAQTLSKQEFGEAAFVMAFSANEAVLRTLAVQERIAKEKDSFEAISKNLFAQGLLARRQYEVLIEAAKVRDAIVHGYKDPQPFTTTVHQVIAITEQLLDEVAAT